MGSHVLSRCHRGLWAWVTGFALVVSGSFVFARVTPPVAAAPGPSCAPLDVVLVIDSSTSMNPAIENVKAQTAALLDRIVTESGGDYRIGLVDFADDVEVRVPFASDNVEAVRTAIPNLYQDRGNTADPEAWDEALVTVIDGRSAAAANADRSTSDGQQIGDFVADWRADAKKVVLLVTDATPGGFDGSSDPVGDDANPVTNPPVRFNRAFNAAVRANERDIRVATVFVPNSNSEPRAADQLASIANETGAPTLRTLPDGSNLNVGLDLFISTCAADSDGDGLYDSWETDGYDADGDGTMDVDLPAMGADPQRKDLFIQVNWMSPDEATECYFLVYCPGRSDGPHPPNRDALQKVKHMFANAPVSNPDGSRGIVVHFDAGGLEPDGTAIGGSSKAGGPVPVHVELSSPGDDYEDFADQVTQLKGDFVPDARDAVFTWVLYTHSIPGVAGIAPGVPGDTALISGIKIRGNTAYEASTLAHELGHTLGLRHGGYDDIHYKPNYLSVMNYGFAHKSGLVRNGEENIVDYSSFDLADLDAQNLSEPTGVTAEPDTQDPAGYKTIHPCPTPTSQDPNQYIMELTDLAPIDWNCNGSTTETGVNIDSSIYGYDPLGDRNDWATITFTGGQRGGLDNSGEPPDETGLTREAYDEVDHRFAIDVTGPGAVSTEPGTQLVRLPFTVANVGTTEATWTATTSSTGDWTPAITTVNPITVQPGSRQPLDVDLSVPGDAKAGTTATISLTLTGDEPGNAGGSATATVTLDGATTASPTGPLTISPTEPQISTKFSASGAGFEPGTSAILTSTNSEVGPITATTDDDGTFTIDVQAPSEAGTISLVAVGAPTGTLSAPNSTTTTSGYEETTTSTIPPPTAPLVLGADVKVVAVKTQTANPETASGVSPLLWAAIAAGTFGIALLTWTIVASKRRKRRSPST